ncbi:HEAT repeat domain-containing protein [Citrobacter braakii]|uniref:HEAT repeat domain-containing protein n=1 Tax=Citrobacter braakii TaxID=57706 RepID=UPI0023B02FCA|nr:HEAT repeat domain-containing protein [Citrobacter braakii]
MPPAIVNLLIGLIETAGNETRIAAIKALGEGAPATPAVISCLQGVVENGGSESRVAAVYALGRIYRK